MQPLHETSEEVSNQERRIRRYFLLSLSLHLGIFLLLSLSQWIFPQTSIPFLPTIQVDVVDLPNKIKSSEPVDTSLPVKEVKQPEPEPAKQAKEESDLKEQQLALEAEKKKEAEQRAKSALEKLRKQVKKDKKEEKKRKEELAEQKRKELEQFKERYRDAIRGNQANQGTSATGAMQATINAYAGHIQERLKENWSLPIWLQSKGLKASVRMYIDARGTVSRFQFIQNSGNDAFDDYVKAAIQRSSPFAPPPEDLAKALRNAGMEVGFPL